MAFEFKTSYETLDEIPEGAREAYEEKNGKYELVRALSKTALENSYKREQEKRKAAEERAKHLPDDFDLEKYNEAMEELEELRGLKEAGSFDEKNKEKLEELVAKRVETERKKFERETAKLKTELETANAKLGETGSKLKTVTLETQARALAAKHKIAEHSIDDALFHVTRAFDLDEDGNVVDRSDAGRTLEDWFSETVPNKPGWTFDPKAGGSGALGGGKSGGGKRTYTEKEFDDLSINNPSKAAEIAAAIGKGEAELVAR